MSDVFIEAFTIHIDALFIDWENIEKCQWCEQYCTDIRWCIANVDPPVDPPPETTLEERIEDQEETIADK